jgi:GGDEF domain-containing protein
MKNRRAFENALDQLEEQDLLLVFLSLDGLEIANDDQGCHAGDRLIVSAARCIEHTFSPHGTCYRVDDGKFRVLLPRSAGSVAYWNVRLDQEIRHQEQTGGPRLSIARGFSYLLDAEGVPKSVSQWKSEADMRMCRDKNAAKMRQRDERSAEILDLF